VVLPLDAAYDFMLFAQRNPKPCPLLDVTDPPGHMFITDARDEACAVRPGRPTPRLFGQLASGQRECAGKSG
jgi:uncharacterized protein YcsI (UPF0317 family)